MKYTVEELKEKAEAVLEAHEAGDVRALHLILTVAILMDTDPDIVLHNIGELANGQSNSLRW